MGCFTPLRSFSYGLRLRLYRPVAALREGPLVGIKFAWIYFSSADNTAVQSSQVILSYPLKIISISMIVNKVTIFLNGI
jgi:hypothetical protein